MDDLKSITEQKKAVADELDILTAPNVPQDYDIVQEISRLKKLYNELSAKEKLLEQENFDEQLLDTEVENQID